MKINKRLTVLATIAIACGAMLSMPAFGQKDTNLSDAEIASVAVTANQVDINYAKIAIEKSKNVDVLKFAKTMTDDHTAIIKQAVALVTKLKVTPKNNAVSKQLLSDAEKTKKMLRSKSAITFDKAYIDNEVAAHKAVISTVENVLIPQSKNAELKKLLQDVVPALKTHLTHAEMVQKMLAKK